jgi:hypothetical protein
MINSRIVLASGLSAATLVLFLAVTASGGALQTGLAPWPGIGVIVMAAAAFVVSWRQRSFLVAGLLAASGIVGLVYGLIVTGFLALVVFPGPILGVIIGIGLTGLGAAKGIEAIHVGRSQTTSTAE